MATRSTDKPARTRRGRGTAGGESRTPALSVPGVALEPALAEELDGPAWDAAWELTPTVHTPVADPGARQRLWTLAEMLRPYVRDAFALADERTALDLHCGEGWLSHKLLEWGARRVLALDERPEALRRAELIREHLAVSPDRLVLGDRRGWAATAHPDRFDVVLITGATGQAHEAELLAGACAATRSVCAVEVDGHAANAVAEAALAAGFGSVDRVRPPLQASPVYVLEQRDLLIAKVAIGR